MFKTDREYYMYIISEYKYIVELRGVRLNITKERNFHDAYLSAIIRLRKLTVEEILND
jgi:hypothetical protein